MNSLFYLLGVFAIMFETMVLIMPRAAYDFLTSGAKKRYVDRTQLERFSSWFTFFYMMWVVAGVFSSNSILFTIILLISVANMKRKFVLTIVNAALTLLLLIATLLNHFYYKLPYFKMFFWAS